MNVVTRVIRWVELDHPINLGDIQSSCRHIGADKYASLRVTEFEEAVRSNLLFKLAMKMQHRKVDVVEQFSIEVDRVARAQEDDHFLLSMVPLEEASMVSKGFKLIERGQ